MLRNLSSKSCQQILSSIFRSDFHDFFLHTFQMILGKKMLTFFKILLRIFWNAFWSSREQNLIFRRIMVIYGDIIVNYPKNFEHNMK